MTNVHQTNMTDIPNLKNLVTKEMVKTIGTGRYAAEYCPWSKIAELLNDNAPGWQPELVMSPEGGVVHRAPVGGYLLIRFRNILTGAVTTEWPQAVQDNRHQAIPWDKIDARDVSDTQRRGFCLAAAAVFNLGIQLWTRDPLESGYSRALEDASGGPELPAESSAKRAKPAAGGEAQFRAAAAKVGLSEAAINVLVPKLKNQWAKSIETLQAKTAEQIAAINAQAEGN